MAEGHGGTEAQTAVAVQMVVVHVAAYAEADVLPKHLDLVDSLVGEEAEVEGHDIHDHCASSTDGRPARGGGLHSRRMLVGC